MMQQMEGVRYHCQKRFSKPLANPLISLVEFEANFGKFSSPCVDAVFAVMNLVFQEGSFSSQIKWCDKIFLRTGELTFQYPDN